MSDKTGELLSKNIAGVNRILLTNTSTHGLILKKLCEQLDAYRNWDARRH